MNGYASSLKRLLLVSTLVMYFSIVTASIASNDALKNASDQNSLFLEKNQDERIENWQLNDTEEQLDNDYLQKTVRVNEQKLMKLTLLAAQYRQAYEDTRIKLQNSLRINEDLIKAFKLQEQIIEEMKLKISSMKKGVKDFKSKNSDNTNHIFPTSEKYPPTAFIKMYNDIVTDIQKASGVFE